mgnify:CR=1 FL=1
MVYYIKTELFTSFVFSVIFPMDLLEKGLAAKNFAMLGLGDIVIPGLFSFTRLLRYNDHYCVTIVIIIIIEDYHYHHWQHQHHKMQDICTDFFSTHFNTRNCSHIFSSGRHCILILKFGINFLL